MLDQVLHVLHEQVLIVVARTVVEYYILQAFCRGFNGIFSRPEPISSLTGVNAYIGTLETV